MSELFRVMKKDGWGIFQVPIDSTRKITYEDASITSKKDREKHFWQKDHLRLFGLDYPKKLEKVGFKVETINMQKTLPLKELKLLRLHKDELLYVVHKK